MLQPVENEGQNAYVTSNSAAYREDLPADCPCAEADETSGQSGWRLLPGPTASAADFDSEFRRNPARFTGKPDATICTAKAVSLVHSLDEAKRIILLPKKEHLTHAGAVTLPAGNGKVHRSKPTHSSWWPLASSNVASLVSDVVKLQ
jgi:hypothetical protein